MCGLWCLGFDLNRHTLTCGHRRLAQVFDAVRHPAFDYSASGATRRLEFSEPTNRGFFTALARQMQFAGRKGCSRTAFELAKLIHSLDPEADPMGMLLTIDYYALQVRTTRLPVPTPASFTRRNRRRRRRCCCCCGCGLKHCLFFRIEHGAVVVPQECVLFVVPRGVLCFCVANAMYVCMYWYVCRSYRYDYFLTNRQDASTLWRAWAPPVTLHFTCSHRTCASAQLWRSS